MVGRFFLAILLGSMLVGLAACVSPEELRSRDEAACQGYGFQQGTTDFANCMQRESLMRRYNAYGPDGYGWYGPRWGYLHP